MKRSVTQDERGELPTCGACGRPTGAGAVSEKDPEDGALAFCDARCREDYYTRMDLASEESEGERRDVA